MKTQEILDHSSMSAMQVTAVGVCVLLNALDGFDVLSISFASPGIAEEWGVDRAALGVVLSMELIGMAVGSIFLGRYADRYGRRPLILCALVVMTCGMLAAGLSSTVVELSIYRFITGLGIGGMLASVNAMVAEYSNLKNRAMSVMLMAGGYPFGAVVGGVIASKLLEFYDWRAVFYFGAAATAVFLVLVWYLLPESISFLNRKRPDNALEKINLILVRMKHQTLDNLPDLVDAVNKARLSLFSPRLKLITLLLTTAFFFHIMAFYFFIKWIPKLVVDMGHAASVAGNVLVWANVGSVTGCILLSLLSLRFSTRHLTLATFLGSIVALSFFGGAEDSLQKLTMMVALTGFFTNAASVGLYALFAQGFPTEVRASGTGFVIGMGRGGAASGPIVAGVLFSLGYGLQPVALIMAAGYIFAFIAIYKLKI